MRLTLVWRMAPRLPMHMEKNGGDPDDPEPVGRGRVNHEADEDREGGGLGSGGHEGHHGRRRAFVNVGRPDVEGSAGDLEAESGEDEGDGDVGERLDVSGGAERGRDVKDVGGAGGAVEQGNAVEEECRWRRSRGGNISPSFPRSRRSCGGSRRERSWRWRRFPGR